MGLLWEGSFMWRIKYSYLLVIFLLLFVISGCGHSDEKTGTNLDNKKNGLKNQAEKQIAMDYGPIIISSTLDELKKQPGGILIGEKVSLEQELARDPESLVDGVRLEEQLKRLLKETKDVEEIQKGLIYLLGSPNYREVIEEATNFKPNFKDPHLPDPTSETTEEDKANSTDKKSAIILLDASSSMLLSSENRIRMDIAKEAVGTFAENIGQESDVSLVVYGHKGSESDKDKGLSCSGIEEIYPLGAYNKKAFNQALDSFESKGWTPLAGAIEKAFDMTKDMEGTITIYIVSDGVETCDGDPVQAAKNFANKNPESQVNIIGFQVDKKAEDQLKKVAEAGNGDYFYAKNAEEMNKTIEKKWMLPSHGDLAWAFTKAPGPWEQLAEMNRVDPIIQNIKNIAEAENERYVHALSVMNENSLISDEDYDELKRNIQDQYETIIELANDLKSEKYDEIKDRVNEIKNAVDEWVEKMKKLKQEQGDLW